MRVLQALLVIFLALIAFCGLGAGFWVVASVAKAPSTDPLSMVMAVVFGSIPFLIGTVALGACVVAITIDVAARDQIAATNRLNDVVTNEARHAQHHRQATGR
jgi:hypothetical protein